MQKAKDRITVFEHEILRFDKGEKQITKDQYLALEKYCGEGVPYFNLIHNGVRFNEYVGVLQVGKTVIEVLPKADKLSIGVEVEDKWRKMLIDMLRVVGSFDIKSTSDSHLKIKPNTILDLYFELFIKEVEYLLHKGLVKQYRKKEGNVNALKGSIQFGKHIQKNLSHQERFYVRHSTYDIEHKLHLILYKTICVLNRINTNTDLHGRIGALLLHFPEMPELKITHSAFEKINLTRKTGQYKKAIEISKLILLQYHPDVSKGRNDVIALMFDMNLLWEKYIFVTLRKIKGSNTQVTAQTSKSFWQPKSGSRSKIRPDIKVVHGDKTYILDTKWKNLNGSNPTPDDLRQMYVYHEYYKAEKVALVYPGSETSHVKGRFIEPLSEDVSSKQCGVISIEAMETTPSTARSLETYMSSTAFCLSRILFVRARKYLHRGMFLALRNIVLPVNYSLLAFPPLLPEMFLQIGLLCVRVPSSPGRS